MLIISPKQLGDGWTQVPAGEPLKTSDQFLAYESGEWRIGSPFTSDKVKNPGRVPWRRPVSFATKREAFGPLVRKIWERKIKTGVKALFS